MYPENLRYTPEHEWLDGPGDAGTTVRVGITEYAQEQLGDIVYVNLPAVGEEVSSAGVIGELESTKSVSDVFAPIDGTVSAVNDALGDNPELCNTDPYGDGWLIEITVGEGADLGSLLSAADYEATITSQ